MASRPIFKVSPGVAVMLKKNDVKINVEALIAGDVDVKEVKDFLLKRPLGFLVFITNDAPWVEYKIFCMNSLRLRYCQTDDVFYEAVGRCFWTYSLESIKYYEFIPYDNWAEIDALKIEVCAYLTSRLVESGAVNFTRKTEYFYGISMKA